MLSRLWRVLSRLTGSVLVAVIGMWFLIFLLRTPVIWSPLQRAYDRLASLQSNSPRESALASMILNEHMLESRCSGRVCNAPSVAIEGYFPAAFAGAVFGRAKPILEASVTYEPAEGSCFARPPSLSSTAGVMLSPEEITPGEGVRILDEVSPSGEIKPVFAAKEGYFIAWRSADDGDEASAADLDLETRKKRYQCWLQAVYQPVGRSVKFAVTDLSSVVGHGDWVLLYPPFDVRREAGNFAIGRAQNMTSEPSGVAIVEVDIGAGHTGLLRYRLAQENVHATTSEVAELGLVMMSFKPDASKATDGKQLLADYEQRQYQNQTSSLRVLPESTLDRLCSVDRAPGTACVWVSVAAEAVPVQVRVIDLQANRVGVFERRVFAGKGITPQAWQRLSVTARRAWLMQVERQGASILDQGKILATPWRG